jgi:hypothetical protein
MSFFTSKVSLKSSSRVNFFSTLSSLLPLNQFEIKRDLEISIRIALQRHKINNQFLLDGKYGVISNVLVFAVE